METYQDLAYKDDLRIGMKVFLNFFNGHKVKGTVWDVEQTRASVKRDDGKQGTGVDQTWSVGKMSYGWQAGADQSYLTIAEVLNWKREMSKK